MLANTATRYGAMARSLHWIIALLIIADLMLGLIGKYTPRSADTADILRGLYSAHKTIGIVVLALAIFRIFWAFTQVRPVPLQPERRAQTLLAETVHWALYGAILILPLSGWLTHSAESGFAPIMWPFGQNMPFVPKSEPLAQSAGYVHQVAGYALIGLVALHIAGALKHALIDRDGGLARMVSGKDAGNPNLSSEVPILPAFAALAFWLFALGFASFGPNGGEAIQEARSPSITVQEPSAGWSVESGTVEIIVQQMGAEVTGQFEDWSAVIDYDHDTGTGSVAALIDTGSLNLGSVTDQAKGAEFFDVENHQTAKFAGDITRIEGKAHRADGTLTLVGQAVPVDLLFDLDIAGDTAVMRGGTQVDRRDFNIGESYDDESTVGFPVAVRITLTARQMAQ